MDARDHSAHKQSTSLRNGFYQGHTINIVMQQLCALFRRLSSDYINARSHNSNMDADCEKIERSAHAASAVHV